MGPGYRLTDAEKVNEYTVKDALSPKTTGESGDFRLTVRSVSVSLSDTAEERSGTMPVMAALPGKAPEIRKDTFGSRTLASLTVKDGRLVLSYEDAVDKDEPPVPTVLSFACDDPGLITLERKGFLSSVMTFEEGKRHRAMYKTPFASFDMTVFSRTVENALTPDGGVLRLVYCVEFKGVAEQKVELWLEACRI